MARSKTSKRWLREHFDDLYVKRAQQEGWRSRAVYKLMELQEKDKLMSPGDLVVDLGAAPGGWSQYAATQVGPKGRVIALDILPMDSLADVEFIEGDFREQAVLECLLQTIGGDQPRPVQLVLSDMAPNISGMNAIDQPRAMYLAELALDFVDQVLAKQGSFVVKLFQGEGFDDYVKQLRQRFDKVSFRKPKASRPRSREVYAVARGYNMV